MNILNKYYLISIICLVISSITYAQKFEKFSNKEGFDQNTILAIEQDLYGFLWYGTANGLIRYDGYEFKTYTTQSKTEGHLSSNSITSLLDDDTTRLLWVGTELGLDVYIPWLEKFYNVPLPEEFLVKHIVVGPKGKIWISGIRQLYICELLDVEKGVFKVSQNIIKEHSKRFLINCFSFKNDGTLILGTNTGLKKVQLGIDVLKEELEIMNVVDFENFNEEPVWTLLNTDDHFWVGTNSNVFKVAIDDDKSVVIKDLISLKSENPFRLTSSIKLILQGSMGIIWIATNSDGLFNYNPKNDSFEHFKYEPKNESGISTNKLNTLFQDNFNVLWIGTAQGGVNKLDLTQKPFITYSHNPYNPYSISDNLITSILEDRNGKLWVSGFSVPLFRSINSIKNGDIDQLKFENLSSKLPTTKGEVMRCIYEDSRGFIWFGSDYSLFVCNPKTNQYKKVELFSEGERFRLKGVLSIGEVDNTIVLAGYQIITLENPWKHLENNMNSKLEITSYIKLKDNRIQALWIEHINSFWLGSNTGLLHANYDQKKLTIDKYYKTNQTDSIKLSYKTVFSLHKENNNLWIGTFGGGLNKMTLNKNGEPEKIAYYRKNDLLPDDAIYGILQDDDSHLWLSTDKGLVKLNIDNNKVDFYDFRDGLAQNNFRQAAYHKGKSGCFYFGGLNGLTVFKPQEIEANKQAPEVLISDLLVNNHKVRIGEEIGGSILLEKSISETKSIAISQNQRIISFNLAVKHTALPSKNKLAYKLEGFNEEWIELQKGKATVTYTNLAPGAYIFKVKAANGDGIWTTSDKMLNLEILPAWYNTWWSYLLFFLLVIGLCIGVIIYFVQLERLKQGLKYEKIDKERIEIVNQGKLRYFTNLSHEFRTPLTLIAGPLERIMVQNKDVTNNKYLSIIQKNTTRLLSMVDQLITFRQAEQGYINLNLVKTTLGDFIYPTTEAFENYALEKNINFFHKVNKPNTEIIIDIEKFERIIFNLLSNSFKNTASNGTISIEANIENVKDENWIQIDVIDNGKGIPPENLESIFERFYQLGNEDGEVSGGGIGLSFCKSLVKLFDGEIYVKSKPNEETRFTVKIPSKNTEDYEEGKIKTPEKSYIKDWIPLSSSQEDEKYNAFKSDTKKKFSILIVENEEDVLHFLYNEFSLTYNITTAKNGIEALDKLKIKEPDLIISDVMMPEMDGYQLCEKIKSNTETCHIPVLLLTALGNNEDIIKGLEFGADEYVSKPFSVKHLQLRVQKVIQNSVQIKQHFSKNSMLPKNDVKLGLSKKDQLFLENITNVIEKNYSDSNFGVGELCVQVGLSTSHFYRRLKQLTGQVPIVYIRNYRLQKAADLLKNNNGFNVSEVRYQIGIESKSYFSTSFKKLYGVSPSEFIKK